MFQYSVNGQMFYEPWTSFATKIATSSNVTYVFDPDQSFVVDEKLAMIPSGVTLDFNGCTLKCKTPIVNRNCGIIQNAKVIFDQYTFDEEENSQGLICSINENKIQKTTLSFNSVTFKKASVNCGCMVGYNTGVISDSTVIFTEMVTVIGSDVSNFGIVCGTNANGNVYDTSVKGGNLTLNEIKNCNAGGICGYSTSGNFDNLRVQLHTIMGMRMNLCNFGGIVGRIVSSKVNNSEIISIYVISILNVKEKLNIGCISGHIEIKSRVENCNIGTVSNLYTISCSNVKMGGLIGSMDFDTYTMKCSVKSISLVHGDKCDEFHAGGLVGYNKGYVDSCSLDTIFKFKSSSIDNINSIGGCIGTNYGMLTDSKVNKLPDIGSSKMKDINNVGGVCGSNYVTVRQCKVTKVDSLVVDGVGKNNCGGLIGYNKGELLKSTIDKVCEVIVCDGTENNAGNVCGHTMTEIIECEAKMHEGPLMIGRVMNKEVDDIQEVQMSDVPKNKRIVKLHYGDDLFNSPVLDMNLSGVNNIQFAFSGTKNFNQPIDDWNTESVTNMTSLFKNSGFNSDMSKINFKNASNDGLEDILSGSKINRRNIGTFFGNLFGDPKVYRIGNIPNIPEINTYELYAFSVLAKDHSLQYSPTVDINTKWLNDNLSKVHIGNTEEETESNGFIVSFSKQVVNDEFKGLTNNRINSKMKFKGQERCVLKLWSGYPYHFKLKAGLNKEGFDLYFRYQASTSKYIFDSHGNFEHEARNYVVYSDPELTKPIKSVIPGKFFYLPVFLNNLNNHSLMMMPFDYKYKSLENNRIGVISCPWIQFPSTKHYDSVIVEQWGSNAFHSFESTFSGLNNVIINENAGIPNMTYCKSMKEMFKGCTYMNPDVSNWSVSNVEDMTGCFEGCASFNIDISNWNISKVKLLTNVLNGAKTFDSDISVWDTRNVIDVTGAFTDTDSFLKKNRLKWNIMYKPPNVEYPPTEKGMKVDLSGFKGFVASDSGTVSYDKPSDIETILHSAHIRFIPSKNDNKIIVKYWGNNPFQSMESMFEGCEVTFDKNMELPVLDFCVNMKNIFRNSVIVNQEHLLKWDTGSVIDFTGAFEGSDLNDIDLRWKTHNAKCMSGMFRNNIKFNGDLQWNVSAVEDVSGMFEGATSFNRNISKWDLKSCKKMDSMFKNASSFNGDIRYWNTKQVTSMNEMFRDAKSFNRNIGSWSINKVRNMHGMFSGVNLETEVYDNILNGWAAQELEYQPNFDGGESKFSEMSKKSVERLRDHGWNIRGVYEVPAAKMVGDPYISPIYGNLYKIPDETLHYRLYQSDDIIVNGLVDSYKDIDKLNSRSKSLNDVLFGNTLDNQMLSFDEMYFITKISIFYKGQANVYDIENETWLTEVSDDIFVSEPFKTIENLNELYSNEGISSINIKIGTFEMKCYRCNNPQIHTGVELLNVHTSSDGLLVKECISKSAIVDNIYSFDKLRIREATQHDGTNVQENFFKSDGSNFVRSIKVL